MSRGTFGEMFKAFRVTTGHTLRAFCKEHGLDPGNTSRLERGLMPPPESDEKLAEYAEALGLHPESDEWRDFFDVAAAERGRIPSDLLNDDELVEKLPVVFRTIRGAKTDGDSLDELAGKLRGA
jgi:transcriptional regulator with XRE-family HTH domain